MNAFDPGDELLSHLDLAQGQGIRPLGKDGFVGAVVFDHQMIASYGQQPFGNDVKEGCDILFLLMNIVKRPSQGRDVFGARDHSGNFAILIPDQTQIEEHRQATTVGMAVGELDIP